MNRVTVFLCGFFLKFPNRDKCSVVMAEETWAQALKRVFWTKDHGLLIDDETEETVTIKNRVDDPENQTFVPPKDFLLTKSEYLKKHGVRHNLNDVHVDV